MYTECPHCRAIFRLRAADLRSARGEVRCGSCRETFDAIEHLRDDRYVVREVEVRVRGEGGRAPAASPPEGGGPGSGRDPAAAPETPPTRDDRPAGDVAPLLGAASAAPSAPVLRTPPSEAMPAVLREDLERLERAARARRVRALQAAAAAVLLALLGAQHAWFGAAEVWAAYPQARGWLEAFCARTGCALPDTRDPSRIQVLTRDVRVHPRYEGALQIAATLVNAGEYAQPYPRLQFTLFNVNGQTIASRIFEPAEYLGEAPPPGAELRPGRPLQVALEVLAPEDVAVSFEFRFL